ncbi:MAG TPA: peptidylprolyl isomerase [Vicinamibacterales bacterium]|jgi:cyclophilin family peptidyl-prolyl cis-trans isomerase|nr:peptidylprolyl isomerase [Vicinamibacterales bacterium]HXR45162.1 peptidylprolyl isomerase [Pseudolysinimonas sp.]
MRQLGLAVAAVVMAMMPGVSAWQASTSKPAAAAPAGQKPAAPAAEATRSPGAGPLITVETVKGSFTFETYPNEAPKSVEHILALVKRRFYDGMRVHRQIPGFIAQFGDPNSRDMSKKDLWGTGSSFNPVGVGEANPKRTHVTGAVAMAYPGKDPRQADSQLYVMLAPRHSLDGDYTVIGQVIAGMDVVRKLVVPDVIRRVTVKE